MVKKIYLLFLLFIVSFHSFSQVNVITVKEFDIDEEGIGSTLEIGANGILVFGVDYEKGDRKFILSHYDSEFELVTKKSIDIGKIVVDSKVNGYNVSQRLVSKDKKNAYFLLQEVGGVGRIIKYDVLKNSLGSIEFELPRKLNISSFLLLNDKIFFVTIDRAVSHLFMVDVNTGALKKVDIPGEKERREIESLNYVDDSDDLIYFSMRYGKSKVHKKFEVFILDQSGDMVELPKTLNNVSDERYIMDASVTKVSESEYMISGSYTTLKKGQSPYASGIYLAKYSGSNNEFINFYSFTDMDEFTSYLHGRSKIREDRAISKAKKKGKDDFIKTLAVNHPIIKTSSGFTFVTEIFFPTYRTETRSRYVNGRYVTEYVQVFDGYQYTHAVILNLDKDGNKISDKCFEMYMERKPFSIIRNIKMKRKENTLVLNFTTGAMYKQMLIRDGEYTERVIGELPPLRDGDNVRYESVSQVIPWFDDFYITYGVQSVKNKNEDWGKRKRKVYYLRKIEVI